MPRGSGKKEKVLSIIFFSLILVIFFLDQCAKQSVEKNLVPSMSKVLLPGFLNLTLVHNSGTAFGIVSHARISLLIASLISVIILGVIHLKLEKSKIIHHLALSLILGGALGNLFDRWVRGYVIDFIDFHIQSHHWYTFNIADSAITLGTVIFGICLLREGQSKNNLKTF